MELHDKFIVINDSGLGGTKLHEETEHNPQAPELYVAPTSPRTRLEYNSHRPELYAAPTSPRTRLPEPYSQDTVLPADATSRKRTSWWKEHFWLFVVTLLVLAALIGGVVGGLINRHHSSDKFDSPASSSSATGTKSPQLASFASPSFSSSTFSADGSDSPALLSSTTGIRSSDLAGATSTSLPSSTLYSAPSGTPSLLDSSPLNSSLASVAWLDDGGVGHRRLYYQDSAGTIKESWWNSTAAVWYRSTVAMGKARLNSPLAAAVVGPKKYNFQLNLYYLDTAGHVVELYTNDGQSWSSGSITSQDIAPSINSGLAAIWTAYDGAPCSDCTAYNLLLAFEDSNNKLQVVNITFSDIQYRALDADPISGSGLAINLEWHAEGSPGVRLYYQKGANSLQSVDWETQYEESAPGNIAGEWTLHEDHSIGYVLSGAPMASFSWGSGAPSGDPLLVGILSSGPQSVYVTSSTPQRSWDTLAPEALNNVQAYSALAANGDRHVYALEGGSVKEFVVSTDGLSWSFVGDVPTEN